MLDTLTRIRNPRRRIGREKDARVRERERGGRGEGTAVTANVISGEKCAA